MARSTKNIGPKAKHVMQSMTGRELFRMVSARYCTIGNHVWIGNPVKFKAGEKVSVVYSTCPECQLEVK